MKRMSIFDCRSSATQQKGKFSSKHGGFVQTLIRIPEKIADKLEFSTTKAIESLNSRSGCWFIQPDLELYRKLQPDGFSYL